MKNLPVFLLLMVFAVTSINLNAQQVTSKNQTTFFTGSYDDVLREARKQDKTVVLDFWAEWCAPCKKMDNETFSDFELAKVLNEKFLVYKVNIDTFDGMEIANRFGVESFPTIITLDSKGKYIDQLKGFFPANNLREKLSQPANQSQAYVSM